MQKYVKKSMVLCALMLGVANVAMAADVQSTVRGPGNEPVRNERFGTCVVTKWSAATDPCAPPAAPVKHMPVVQKIQPIQPVSQLQREELTIYFDFNKATLTAASQAKLDKIVDAVKRSPKVIKIDIVGYTDQIGGDDYNKKLSEERAEAAKNYLTGKVNIDVGVLGLRGLGKADPVVDCSKSKARKKKIVCMAKDRRVEIEFEFK